MASGGSSRRLLSESRSFDGGPDDLLFTYEDYTQQRDQAANAKRSDSPAKDFHGNKAGKPLTRVYGQQEEFNREDIVSSVEVCMKKYADNLMRNLDEIGGRLTQLGLFCYKLERSLNEFRTDMIHGQSEGNVKLNSLEKHVQMVQRSLQIVRDKQELLETHRELTKLQLSQTTETANSSLSQKHNEDVAATTSDTEVRNAITDGTNQQLALALPNQMPASASTGPSDQNPSLQQPPPALNPTPQDQYVLSQASSYYTQHQAPPQQTHVQHLHPDAYHQSPLMYNLSVQPLAQQQQPHPNQLTQSQQFSQYQYQQWPQPALPQQPTSPAYLPYAPEAFQRSNMLPPAPYSAPQSSIYGGTGSSISHPSPPHNAPQSSIYGGAGSNISHPPPPHNAPQSSIYGGAGGSISHPAPPHNAPQSNIYGSAGGSISHPPPHNAPQSNIYGNASVSISHPPPPRNSPQPSIYGGAGSNISHPPPPYDVQLQPPTAASQGSFAPMLPPPHAKSSHMGVSPYLPESNVQGYNPTFAIDGSRAVHPQGYRLGKQIALDHPYSEMIEKAVIMGYPMDHAVSVMNQMGKTGQPFDFNDLLDELNSFANGGPPRAWSS